MYHKLNKMELKTLIGVLCAGLSFLLSACAAHHPQYYLHGRGGFQSRKLKVFQIKGVNVGVDVRGGDTDNSESYYKHEDAYLSGNPSDDDHKETSTVHAKGATWREWVEGNKDSSDFFTMDYAPFRKRLPIHNKSLPSGTVAP